MVAFAVGMFTLTSNFALAQGHGNGHEKGHEKHGDGDDQDERYYKDHDRDTVRRRTQEQPSARTCQARSVAPWIGKTTCAARLAPAWAPETAATLS